MSVVDVHHGAVVEVARRGGDFGTDYESGVTLERGMSGATLRARLRRVETREGGGGTTFGEGLKRSSGVRGCVGRTASVMSIPSRHH